MRRLADAVPSANAHRDSGRVYLKEGFLYKPGDKVILTGMMENPEYNGYEAIVSGYRPVEPNKFCPSGCAYYLQGGPLPWENEYIYQERLKLAGL